MASAKALTTSLEQARRQQQSNDTLRSAVLDTDELAQRVLMQTTALKRRSDLTKWTKQLSDQLSEFEKQCSFINIRRFNPAKMLAECDQHVGMGELVHCETSGKADGLPQTDNVAEFTELLNGFKTIKQNADRTAKAPLSQFAEEAKQAAEKSRTLVKETTLQSSIWRRLPEALMTLLQDVIAHPQTKLILEQHDEQLKRMVFGVEECSQQQEQAIADGDMKQAEVLYFKKISLQEAMVDVFNKMYAILDAHHADCFVDPLKRVHEVHKKGSAEISAIMQKNESLKQRVGADLESLNGTWTKLHEEDRGTKQGFAAFAADNDKQLRLVVDEQHQILAQIEELEKRLLKLGGDRTELVNRRIQAIENEARRQADLANFDAFCAQHKKLLEATTQTTEVSEEVTDVFDEMICNGCNAIEQYMRDLDQEIEAERMRVHELRLQHFRSLYLTIGDLQYKKERNMEELDKKISFTTIQQELAMETFNPKAKEFSQMKKDLLKVRDEMNSQVQTLQEKAQLHIEAFKPTEVALIECGKSFVHPAEELEGINRQRQQKLIEYQNLMSAEEGGGEEPEKVHAELEKEVKAIEEERQTVRKTHSSHHKRTPGFGISSELDTDPPPPPPPSH